MTFIAILAIIILISTIIGIKTDSGPGCAAFIWMLLVWLIGFMIYDTKYDQQAIADRQAEAAREAAQRKANETPHVVREADGCKVYAFLSGDRYHYFTRCPDSKTTTDTSWDECHSEMVGKVSTRKCVTKSEAIEVTK